MENSYAGKLDNDQQDTTDCALPRECWPELLISGGQSGVDYGALLAAKSLGIPTGGYAPKGWRTQRGPNPKLGTMFGLIEHPSNKYPPRTRANVEMADATLIISVGLIRSPGSDLTERICRELNKLYMRIRFDSIQALPGDVMDIRYWISNNAVKILNVAGHREETCPGIENRTRRLIRRIFVDERAKTG